MPTLKDSEWRLLCLIVRATWGWKEGSGRKRSDWITQRQMMQRTGRSSEALSRAVDALVKRGLIEVCDEDGTLLDTPEQRRRCGGRLYFSVKNMPDDRKKSTSRKSEEVENNAKPTDYSRISRSHKSEVNVLKNEALACKSGVRKSNTTKETETKYLQKESSQEDLASCATESLAAQRSRLPFDASPADINRFVHRYRELGAEYKLGAECTTDRSLPRGNGMDSVIACDLLRHYSFEHLMGLLTRFLRESQAGSDCSLPAFQAAIKSLLVAETRERLLRPREISRVPSPRLGSGWSRAGDTPEPGDTPEAGDTPLSSLQTSEQPHS